MNRITITIESKGQADSQILPIHNKALRALLENWDDASHSKPEGTQLYDYDNVKVSYKVERGVENTF